EHLLDFAPAGAVKASAERRERLDERRLRVALDCVEWLDAGHEGHPLLVLTDEHAEVDHVERPLGDALLSDLVLDDDCGRCWGCDDVNVELVADRWRDWKRSAEGGGQRSTELQSKLLSSIRMLWRGWRAESSCRQDDDVDINFAH